MLTALLAAPAGGETVTLFVTSEKTDTVNVFHGKVPDLTFVKGIPVGREPHNLGISPDDRWVATSDRRSGEVSVIDTQTLMEAARLKLGRQTHDVAFTPDSRMLFVGHETETFITSNTVTIIDGPRRVVLGTLKVPPRPHGLAVLVHSP
jgi:DNA-binding beta-propeller fold protein YncE